MERLRTVATKLSQAHSEEVVQKENSDNAPGLNSTVIVFGLLGGGKTGFLEKWIKRSIDNSPSLSRFCFGYREEVNRVAQHLPENRVIVKDAGSWGEIEMMIELGLSQALSFRNAPDSLERARRMLYVVLSAVARKENRPATVVVDDFDMLMPMHGSSMNRQLSTALVRAAYGNNRAEFYLTFTDMGSFYRTFGEASEHILRCVAHIVFVGKQSRETNLLARRILNCFEIEGVGDGNLLWVDQCARRRCRMNVR